ncbi:MAG: hypothetical protein D6812_04825 [Deltaproteobacteria bacterium]|nr:MAG: hypothetical protein D6812_04825 [Deltaproteobacteria bacterium]
MEVAILGASDPEMERIERLLRSGGYRVLYAAKDGRRVSPSVAYEAEEVLDEEGELVEREVVEGREVQEVLLVECGVSGIEGRLIDHHNPGDPGYGVRPTSFLSGSSLGQVMEYLAEEWAVYSRWDDAWLLGGRKIPEDLLLACAADHCLAAAYWGQCPGIDPERLCEWRIETRARFQGAKVERVRARLDRMRQWLSQAPKERFANGWLINCLPGGGAGVVCGEHGVECDGQHPDGRCWGHVPGGRMMEIVDAAMLEMVAIVSRPRARPGERSDKVMLLSATPEQVKAWLRGEGPPAACRMETRRGLPERGFGFGAL